MTNRTIPQSLEEGVFQPGTSPEPSAAQDVARRVAELKAALKPFAAYAAEMTALNAERSVSLVAGQDVWGRHLTVADFRRAERASVSSAQQPTLPQRPAVETVRDW